MLSNDRRTSIILLIHIPTRNHNMNEKIEKERSAHSLILLSATLKFCLLPVGTNLFYIVLLVIIRDNSACIFFV